MSKKLICLASFVLVLSMVLTGPANAADPNLVGWWQFDEDSGTTASDSSGNGNDGILNGNPQWVVGFLDGALEFGGAGDEVSVPYSAALNPQDSFTVSAWVNAVSGRSGHGAVISCRDDLPQRGYIIYAEPGNTWQFWIGVGTGDVLWNAVQGPSIQLDEWVHVAAVYSDGTQRFYVDGEFVGESSATLNVNTAQELLIGAGANETANHNYFFEGAIDEVRLYNRPLSADEIKELALRPKAHGPTPEDGALLTEFGSGILGYSLSWKPGDSADSHDVYFGTDYAEVEAGTGDTFRGNQSSLYFLAGYGYTPNDPCPTGFVPGTTYYWRIDEVNDTDPNSPWKGNVWSFSLPATKAYTPSPADGSKFIDPNADLSWVPGFGAIAQTVYFGDDYDTISTATTGGTDVGGATTYDPGPLELETFYYWRVDAIVGAFGPATGDVWSFTTLPVIPITDPNLVGWWKFDAGSGTIAIDWSGHENHGTLNGPQWMLGYDGDALEFDGANDTVSLGTGPALDGPTDLSVAAWIKTSTTSAGVIIQQRNGGFNGEYRFMVNGSGQLDFMLYGDGDYQYTFTTTKTVNDDNWHHVVAIRQSQNGYIYVDGRLEASDTGTIRSLDSTIQVAIGADVRDSVTYFNGTIDDVRIYNKALTQEEVKQAMRGDPLLAWDPNPTNGSRPDIDEVLPLSWSPGDNASGHDVYFGTDKDAVDNADTTDTTGIYRDRLSSTSYTPTEGVEWGGGPYYWRIDEYNTDGTISKGKVWSFTVADFISIDNIEGYDAENQIWYNWVDGLGYVKPDTPPNPGNGTGSEVGDPDTASFTEETIVHGGGKSMPFKYNNNDPFKLKYSEAKLTLSAARDWTKQGVKALSLWFQGYPASVGSFTDNFDGTYTMTGAGEDIWDITGIGTGFHDEFHFAYKMLTGTGTIVARVDSVQDTYVWAKAGVMIRETLDPNSAHAMMVVTPGSGVAFQGRPSAGDASFNYNQTGITAPHWVKLERDLSGNFTVSHSTDGSSWEPVTGTTPENIPMTTNVYVGLALTSHEPAITCEAVFSNITITGNFSGQWASQDIGIMSNDAEPMYVAIANNTGQPAVVFHDDPNAAQIDTWTEWNIDLRDFAGINLADVNSIAVGLGNRNNPQAGGAGKMYFDDIALYRPRCVPEKVTLSEADLNSDCLVDFRDLEIMTGDWLAVDTSFALEADLNSDGTVDFKDYAVLADQWLDEQIWPDL